MLVEFLMLVLVFFVFFVFCIVYIYFDFILFKLILVYLVQVQCDQVIDVILKLQKVLGICQIVEECLEVLLKDVLCIGDIIVCKVDCKNVDVVWKSMFKDFKVFLDIFQLIMKIVFGKFFMMKFFVIVIKVEILLLKEKEMVEKLQQK